MANYDQGQLLGSLMLVMREIKTWGEEATAGSLYCAPGGRILPFLWERH